MYVMGGGGKTPKPEVLDTRCMDDGWRELQDSTDVPGYIAGHAVIDGGKRILVQSLQVPHLYCYDVEADSWQVYLKHVKGLSPGFPPGFDWESAFVDGILYYVDNNRPGLLWGIDVSRPDDPSDPKMVRLPVGCAVEDWPWEWIPQRCPENEDYMDPEVHLLKLGSEKLGLLWCIRKKGRKLHVYRSTIKISKEEKKHEADGHGGDNFDLVAHPLSFSHLNIHGCDMDNWLAGYPSQSTGPKEDVYKGSIGDSKNRKKKGGEGKRVGGPSTKELAENCTSSSKSTLGCPGKAKTATSSSSCHGVSIEQAIEERDQALEKLAELNEERNQALEKLAKLQFEMRMLGLD